MFYGLSPPPRGEGTLGGDPVRIGIHRFASVGIGVDRVWQGLTRAGVTPVAMATKH